MAYYATTGLTYVLFPLAAVGLAAAIGAVIGGMPEDASAVAVVTAVVSSSAVGWRFALPWLATAVTVGAAVAALLFAPVFGLAARVMSRRAAAMVALPGAVWVAAIGSFTVLVAASGERPVWPDARDASVWVGAVAALVSLPVARSAWTEADHV
ncbi:hypothetical protein ROJ8625_00013 [Roseivivax jejudonensis]|uniref:Uncharacterized protein n=1 Tax=Roseivivax jejudonensis TaxID=1529041 RepID=A0A1X6Y2N7_9RHOB|nr:hypothetical protein ROJ8625_00013 [Roseivivax jejudonensis]